MITPEDKNNRRRIVRQFGPRRRRDGGPAAGQPAPVDPRDKGGLNGGAAATLTFDD